MTSINTISTVLLIVAGVVGLIVEAGRKDWVMFAAWSCLGVSAVLRLIELTPWEGYLSIALSFAFAVFVMIHGWQLARDPKWRAAWFK
jgi:hypothetical protein